MSENRQTSAGETQQGTSCAPLAGETFAAFVDTIAALRAPNGCPWDREQTHESIARNMIEEAYEAVDAIEQHDAAHLREELGDVLCRWFCKARLLPTQANSPSPTYAAM